VVKPVRAIAVLVALASLVAGLAPAFGASAYPDRPIRLVVPSTPGGGTDLSMRVVAPKLAVLLEQQIVIVPSLLVSHPSLPAKNVKELIAFARARPGQLQFASAGLGSAPHLMMALFNNLAWFGVKS
jgi:tripartite-type tricarboxylate transporter receptor subunit TctC